MATSSALTIGDLTVAPGEKRSGWYHLAYRTDGSPVRLPLILARGAKPGPTLYVHGGVHGNEYIGPIALLRVMAGFDPKSAAGTVIAVPFCNPPAMDRGTRKGEFDESDVNRLFPGKSNGFFSDQLCKVINDEFVERADYVIDLHSGGFNKIFPHVIYANGTSEAAMESLEMAKVYGTSYLHGGPAWPNVIRMAAVQRGIPTITPEVGGEGRLTEPEVQISVRGIMNVMRYVGILEGDPEGLPARYTKIEAHPSGEYMYCRNGGILLHHVEHGANIKEGDLLGVIVNPLGECVEEVRANHDGLLMGMRTRPQLFPGEWTYFVAVLKGHVDGNDVRRHAVRVVPRTPKS